MIIPPIQIKVEEFFKINLFHIGVNHAIFGQTSFDYIIGSHCIVFMCMSLWDSPVFLSIN